VAVFKTDKRNRNVTGKLNDRGSSIIIVIVAVAFIGMLASVILWMSMINMQMKYADFRSKNNFYTAETVLDQINLGLQNEVSYSFKESYSETMQKYSALDENARQASFIESYKSRLCDKLAVDQTSAVMKYDVDSLKKYVDQALLDQSEITAIEGKEAVLSKTEAGVVLKNLKVSFTNTEGYKTIIATDIVLNVPDIDFTQTSTISDLFEFCLISDTAVEGNNTGENTQIAGNVYGGKEGISISGASSSWNVSNATLFVTDEAISVTQGASLTTNERTNIWAKDLLVDSADLTLKGANYLLNDLTIDGVASAVTLENSYYGYGNSADLADESSSIIINGSDATLNMSGLKNLVLAGRSYIGTGSVTAADASGASNKDILMGESIAVKGNQVAYMVPAECIGGTVSSTEVPLTKTVITSRIDIPTGSLDNITDGNRSTATVWKDPNSAIAGDYVGLAFNKVIQISKLEFVMGTDANPLDTFSSARLEYTEDGFNWLPVNGTIYRQGETISVTGLNIKALKVRLYATAKTEGRWIACREINVVENTQAAPAASAGLKNPMTSAEYKLLDDKVKAGQLTEVNLNKKVNSMDKELSYYASSYPGYQKIFSKSNGDTLVYYYLVMNEEKANEYFRDYYGATAGQKIEDSLSLYNIDEIAANAGATIKIAGNMVTYDKADSSSLTPDTKADMAGMQTDIESTKDQVKGLKAKLASSYNGLSDTEKSQTVYNNIIKTIDFKKFLQYKPGNRATFPLNATGAAIKAIFIDDPNSTYQYDNESISLIVTSGNVSINKNFDGLIIAGGTITVAGSNLNIRSNKEDLVEILNLPLTDVEKSDTLLSMFNDGTSYALFGTGDGSSGSNVESAIRISDLVTYQNWSKQ